MHTGNMRQLWQRCLRTPLRAHVFCVDSRQVVCHVVAAAPKFHTAPGQDQPPKRSQQGPRQQSTGAIKQASSRARKSNSDGSNPQGPQRLSKVMAAAGVASRRASEELIAQGAVKVNGQVVSSQVLVDPAKDEIEVNNKKLKTTALKEHLYYFALNKPKGYICSNAVSPGKEEGSRAIDVFKPWLKKWAKGPAHKGLLPPRLFTVGRLDVATTGLIFVTNDGHWANSVIHPSADITKEYLLLVDKAPSRTQLETMMRGVEIDGVRVCPEEVSTTDESVRLRVVVNEGKKHEGGQVGVAGWDGQATGPPRHNSPAMPPRSAAPATASFNAPCAPAVDAHNSAVGSQWQIPRFDSTRLIVSLHGQRMWVWNVSAWMLSQAVASRPPPDYDSPSAPYIDPLTGHSWQEGQNMQGRQWGKYRNAQPFRRPVARWWRFQAQEPAVAPPTVLTPGQWQARSYSSQSAALLGNSRSPAVQSSMVAFNQARELEGDGNDDNGDGDGEASIDSSMQMVSGAFSPGLDETEVPCHGSGSLDADLVCQDEPSWKVRLLAAAADLEVLGLKRVRVGGFRMPRTMRLGEYIALTPAQLKKVTDSRAQQAAAVKQPFLQKAPARIKPGLPDPESLAAMLEASASKSVTKHASKSRPPRRSVSKDDD